MQFTFLKHLIFLTMVNIGVSDIHKILMTGVTRNPYIISRLSWNREAPEMYNTRMA